MYTKYTLGRIAKCVSAEVNSSKQSLIKLDKKMCLECLWVK